MTDIFTTKQDAIEAEILPALSEYVDQYDIDAIADELFEWEPARDADGTEHLNRQGFKVRADVDFWEIAERHEREQFTLTMPETGTACEITAADGEYAGVVAIAESEDWEPETYDEAIKAEGFERIDDWQDDGAEHTCHLVRI